MNGKSNEEDIEIVELPDCTEVWVVKYEHGAEVSRRLWKKLPRNPGGSGQDFSFFDLMRTDDVQT